MFSGFRYGAGKTLVTGAERRLQRPIRYKMPYPRKHWEIRQLRVLLPEMRYKIS
jgi:hypothetical protein